MVGWQLAEAKNKFSEVFTKAIEEGPQRVQRRGEAVIVISEDEYNSITGAKKSFKDFLLSAPDFSDLDLTRTEDYMREDEW